MKQRDTQSSDSQIPQPPSTKELLTLAGVAVLFVCSIFSLIVLIGGVIFPLGLLVVWDLANIVFSIVVFLRAVGQIRDHALVGTDEEYHYMLAGAILVGSLICVIGSFYSENFIAVHSLLLFVVLALWLATDIRRK